MRGYLTKLRKKNAQTQYETAKKAGIGQSYYNSIEKADRQKDMSIETMERLARAFDVPILEIFMQELEYRNKQASISA